MNDSIKEECLSFFVTKDTFNGLMKYLLPIIGVFMSAAFAYAWNEIVERGTMKSDLLGVKHNEQVLMDSLRVQLSSNAKVSEILCRKIDTLMSR